MIKKLLLPFALITTTSLFGATEITKDDAILSDIKQLSEEQMQVVKGEDITTVTIFPISNRPRVVQVSPNSHVDLTIIINGDTGEVIQYIEG